MSASPEKPTPPPAAQPDAILAARIHRASPPAHSSQPPRADKRTSLVFTRLKWTSFTHSCIYTALLICAFAAGKPQPETFVLGLTHGILWICMSLACIICVRLRIVPLRLSVAVAVLGGIGPFFGSYEFVREQRRREMQVKPCEERVQAPVQDSIQPPTALE